MTKKNKLILTKPLLVFMGAMILANIASRMYAPLLALYIKELGADIQEVGLFFTLSMIAPLFFQILGGWLSDSLGRLKAVAIGSIGGLMGFIVFMVAPTWHWLLLASITSSISSSFVGPSFQAFIAEQSTEENRGRIYGLTDAIFMIVGIIGPIVGGYLSDGFGFKSMFMVAGILYAVATVIRIGMARNSHQAEKITPTRPTFSNLKISLAAMVGMVIGGGILTWILISDGFRDIAFNMAFQFLPVYMQDLYGITKTQIGIITAIGSAVTMVMLMPGGMLSDKKGERVGIVLGFMLIVGAMGLFLLSHSYLGFIISWSIFGVGEALIAPAYNSLISKVVPEKLRGTAFGLFTTSIGFISLPAPYLGGILWDKFGPKFPFYVPMLTTLFLLPVMWKKFVLPPRNNKPEDVAVSHETVEIETPGA